MSTFLAYFLPRDAMRKRGLSIVGVRPSVCPSVRPARSCIVSIRLKISSDFFLGQVAPSLYFLAHSAGVPIPRGTPYRGHKIYGRENLRFLTEIAIYPSWPLVTIIKSSHHPIKKSYYGAPQPVPRSA